MTPEITTYVFLILKALTLFGLGMYIIFAFVILRQEQLMADVLKESFEPVLRLASFLHMIASVVIFFLAILLL